MVVTYYGDGYFRFQSGDFTVLVDPTNSRALKGANVIINTIRPNPALEKDDAAYEASRSLMSGVWIENQGEYQINGLRVRGWDAGEKTDEKISAQTVYVFDLEEIKAAALGPITQPLSANLLEEMQFAFRQSEINVLILPAQGKPFIEEVEAAKLAARIEPNIVLPAFFKQAPKKFFSEFNQSPKPEEKLVLKKKALSEEKTVIHWLQP